MQAHYDVFTTLAAAAGMPDIRERLAGGDSLGTDVENKGYIDGLNNLDYWTGKTNESARDEYIYYAESNLQAIRVKQWKMHFYTRSGYYGTTKKLELPYLFNIRQDPFESYGMDPMLQHNMFQHKTYMFNAALERIEAHLKTFEKHPPSQTSARSSQRLFSAISRGSRWQW